MSEEKVIHFNPLGWYHKTLTVVGFGTRDEIRQQLEAMNGRFGNQGEALRDIFSQLCAESEGDYLSNDAKMQMRAAVSRAFACRHP